MKNLLFIALFLVVSTNSYGQNHCNTIDFENYELYWSDDFNDPTTLNSQWQNIYWGNGCNNFNPYFSVQNENGTNVMHKEDDDVRWIENGILNLSIARLDPPETENPFVNGDDITFNYKAGFIRSKDTNSECANLDNNYYPTFDNDGVTICEESNQGFSHGLFVCRAKMGGSDTDGFKSSLWLRTISEEIDIIEYDATYHDKTQFLTNYHTNQTNTKSCGAFVETGVDLREDFHTYAVEWTPYKVTYYFDGEEIRTMDYFVTNGCEQSYNFIASVRLLAGDLTDQEIADIAPLQIDYVKVYQRIDDTKPGKINWNSQCVNQTVHDVDSDLTLNQNGKVFYRTADNKMRYLIPQSGNEDFYYSDPVGENVNNVAGDITIDFNSGRVYYRGTDSKLWSFYWANSQWNNSLTHPNDNVHGDLAINSNGKVFYRKDNRIFYTFYSGGNWWNEKAIGLNNILGEIVIDMPTNKMYYVGTDNNVWVAQWAGESYWNKYRLTDSGNVDTNLSVTRIDNVEHIYYAGLDKILHVLKKVGYLEYTDERVYGTVYNPYTGNPTPSSEKLVDNVKGNIVISEENHIFFQGTDANIWEVYNQALTESNPNLQTVGNDGHIFYEQINQSPTNFGGCLISDGHNSMFYKSNNDKAFRLNYFCERLEGSGWFCDTGEKDPINVGRARRDERKDANPRNELKTKVISSEEYNIYPNPVNSLIFIEREEINASSECSVRLIDIQGRLVKEGTFFGKDTRLKMNCEDVMKGIYILQIESNNSVVNKKIVISR